MIRTRIALAVAGLLASGHVALANPTGPSVVSGSATFAPSGSTLTVTNTPNTIINWQTFSIGAGEVTRFNQQSELSAVLNRVTTQNPSSILGTLESNGRVFLINPNGILFGAGSQIDVAGLVASTLNISDSDFLSGRMLFTGEANAGPIVNNGTITATGTGAPLYLIGSSVINGGVVASPRGEVVLAAGESVEIAEPGTPNLRVEITAPSDRALNLGQVVAGSGPVNLFAALGGRNGITQANTVAQEADGRIVLRAADGLTVADAAPPAEQAGATQIRFQDLFFGSALVVQAIVAPAQAPGAGLATPPAADAAAAAAAEAGATGVTGVRVHGASALGAQGLSIGPATPAGTQVQFMDTSGATTPAATGVTTTQPGAAVQPITRTGVTATTPTGTTPAPIGATPTTPTGTVVAPTGATATTPTGTVIAPTGATATTPTGTVTAPEGATATTPTGGIGVATP